MLSAAGLPSLDLERSRSGSTRRGSGRIRHVLGRIFPAIVALAFLLPSSRDGTFHSFADPILAVVACLIGGAALGLWFDRVSVLTVVLVTIGLLSIVAATLTSPFYGQFALGLAPSFVAFFLLSMVRPDNQTLNEPWIGLERMISALSWVFVLWGVGVVVSNKTVTSLTVRLYPEFDQEIVRFLVIEVHHPVGSFGTHSAAGFMYFILFLTAYRRWLSRSYYSSLALAVSLIWLLLQLRSFSGLFLGALSILILAVPQVAFRSTTWHDIRNKKRALYAMRMALILGLVALLPIIGTYARSIFEVRAGGFSGRFSNTSGRIGPTIEYLTRHPFRPIGFTQDAELVFGDSAIVDFYLRGGLILVITLYALWFRLLGAIGLAGRTRWVIVAALLAFDLGFSGLMIPRFQLAMLPLLMALRPSGGRETNAVEVRYPLRRPGRLHPRG